MISQAKFLLLNEEEVKEVEEEEQEEQGAEQDASTAVIDDIYSN